MDDDWFDDSSAPKQGGSADPLTSKEYDRIAARYSDAGYREGITDGKLSTLQEGFDQSFSASVPPSRRLGNLRGRAAALLAFCTAGKGESADVDKLRELVVDLGRVRRDDILPPDVEREEHEREEHADPDGEGFELDLNDKREMEGLERALEGVSTTPAVGSEIQGKGKREGELLDDLERRLAEAETELRGSY